MRTCSAIRILPLPLLACAALAVFHGGCKEAEHAGSEVRGTDAGELAPGTNSDPGAVPTSSPPAEQPEDPELTRARAAFDEARAAKERGDLAAAREKAIEAIEALLAEGEGEEGEAQTALWIALGTLANDAGDLKTAERARRRVVEVLARALPPDHGDLQRARLNLATTLALEGQLPAARALEEQVVEVFSRTLPPEHPDLQLARMNLATMLRIQGESAAARAMYEQVIEVDSRTLPADHPVLQKARLGLANVLYEQGDLPAARGLYEQVVEVLARTRPAADLDLQAARVNLANLLRVQGDFDGARALCEQVVEVESRSLPADHPALQVARLNLASIFFQQGELSRARALYAQVVEVRSRTLSADSPELQVARMNLANTLLLQGELSGARDIYERVLEVYGRTLPPDHGELQKARTNLALTLQAQGELPAARSVQEQVLEVYGRTLPPDHLDLQGARNNLANTLQVLGDLTQARALYEQVIEAYARTLLPDHPELQGARSNLASTLCAQGDLPAARALQEQVLEVYSRTLPPEHPHLQAARLNLATTLREQGELSAARDLLEQVLEAYARALPPEHLDVQTARSNLASTLYALGELDAARALQEQVLEVEARNLPPDHPATNTARNNLAIILYTLGSTLRGSEGARIQEREECRKRCLEIAASLARSSARDARTVVLSSSSREAEERCSSLQRYLSSALSFAGGSGVFAPDPELQRDAFVLSETTRAGALASARIARLARTDERCAGLRREIQAAGEELAALAQAGATPQAFGVAIEKRDRAQRELVQLAASSSGAAHLLGEPDPAGLAAQLSEGEALVAYRRYLRWEFPAGEEKDRATESLCAFVLRKGQELECIELGAIEPVEAAVQAWRTALGAVEGRGEGVHAHAGDLPEEMRQARRLSALILHPLLPSLGGVRHVVIVLDDVLNAVPIDALPAPQESPGRSPTGATAQLFGERFEIELRSTTQELLGGSASPSGAPLVLLVGGADYFETPSLYTSDPGGNLTTDTQEPEVARVASLLRGGAWGDGFAPLPATTAEVRGLEGLAKQVGEDREVVRLENERASRSWIEALAPRARFLHLATHGWFAPESVKSWSDPEPVDKRGNALARTSAEERVKGLSPMLLCGLALAGANLPADALGRYPGLVTAEEISGWDLANCELAVLSACDTNVGERRAGQGVASLQKALHMAGARTVITSLWRVPDEVTKELMLDFYRRIWVEKKPKAQALWDAKTKLRDAKDESGTAKYSTRDWAAWVLTGDPK